MAVAVYGLTRQGAALARRLAEGLDGELHLPRRLDPAGFETLAQRAGERFRHCRGHVFVAASGIVVRAVAPLLQDKRSDPGVVVCDPGGRFAVALLGGHLGGANDLARRAAAVTGGEAVITTATDAAGAPALDLRAREQGLRVDTPEALAGAALALAEGRGPLLYDPGRRLYPPDDPSLDHFRAVDGPGPLAASGSGVAVDWRALDLPPGVLVLRPRVLGVGVGCRKGAAARDVLEAVDAALARCNAARGAVFALASLELKAGEPGLLEAARILEADTAFFSAEELRTFDPPTPSRAVRERVGVDSVCESAAMALCRTTRLLVQKTKTPRATAAVARCG